MKELRLTLDDALYERAERLAARRGFGLDEFLRDYLVSQTPSEGEAEDAYEARMNLVAMARRQDIPRRLIPWNREELYERGVSGHERDRLRGFGSDGGPSEVGQGGDPHGA
jgi:hypothetical protein